MIPLYLARATRGAAATAALRPQHISLAPYSYLFARDSAILRSRRGDTNVGQAGLNGPVSNENKNWRNGCQRASKQCWHLALWPLSRPVRIPRRSRNMSWSIPSPSRKSRPTPASTSKPGDTLFGQACGPVRHDACHESRHYAGRLNGGGHVPMIRGRAA